MRYDNGNAVYIVQFESDNATEYFYLRNVIKYRLILSAETDQLL